MKPTPADRAEILALVVAANERLMVLCDRARGKGLGVIAAIAKASASKLNETLAEFASASEKAS